MLQSASCPAVQQGSPTEDTQAEFGPRVILFGIPMFSEQKKNVFIVGHNTSKSALFDLNFENLFQSIRTHKRYL